MRECARVEPLDEVFEVLRVVGGKGERGGEGFAETVVGIECCGEERRDGQQGFEVEGEGVQSRADIESDGSLEEVSVLGVKSQ